MKKTFILLLAACCISSSSLGAEQDIFGGREILLHVPATLPPPGERALVVVLHGGMGNASRIVSGGTEHGMSMDEAADKHGFIVAYLNGTPVARRLGEDKRGWNAGGCCGLPARNGVDDVSYLQSAIGYLTDKYGVDRQHIFGIGHSNGAMMTLRLLCEKGIYAAAIPISGALVFETESCPAARGRNILALHGAEDTNVPLAGGMGSGLARVVFPPQSQTERIFTASGATYRLEVLDGIGHNMNDIAEKITAREGVTFSEKAARFFGLAK